MSIPTATSLVLVIAGALANAPALILLGILTFGTSRLSTLWSDHGLDEVDYERRLERDRAVLGDTVAFTVEITNRKLLPLAWLRAEDYATDLTVVREQRLTPSMRPGYSLLTNLWALAPFETVRRTFHLGADRRGLYRFESVQLTVADLFGRGVASREVPRPQSFLVRPRTVPVRAESGSILFQGTRAARSGLVEDPSLFAGIRPFQRGDPRRRVHERASARIGRPMSKRYEPPNARVVLLALDLATHDGPSWLLAYDDDLVETLVVSAASLIRRFLADGAACGIAVNGWTYSLATHGLVLPRSDSGQLARITDLLARTSSNTSVPFARMLGGLPKVLPPDCMVVTMSSRDPGALIPLLRRLRAIGHDVRHVAVGPHAARQAAVAARFGIPATSARLDPDWRHGDALHLAG